MSNSDKWSCVKGLDSRVAILIEGPLQVFEGMGIKKFLKCWDLSSCERENSFLLWTLTGVIKLHSKADPVPPVDGQHKMNSMAFL